MLRRRVQSQLDNGMQHTADRSIMDQRLSHPMLGEGQSCRPNNPGERYALGTAAIAGPIVLLHLMIGTTQFQNYLL
jgi:hypothetical protein